jgi:hypothetical protein
MRLVIFLLLLTIGCSQPPTPNPTPPVQTPPPLEAPLPKPPTLPPVQPVQYGVVSFTTQMSPRWFDYKLVRYAYYLEWQLANGSWRPALTYLEHAGVGWVGYMSEAAPTVSVRLPVGNYRVVYGLPRGSFAYYHNEPWQEYFTLTADKELNLHSTFVWE